MKLLIKILRQNVSVWHIVSFVLANLIGGMIVLAGLQAYSDADRYLSMGGNVLGDELLVVSKPVSGLTTVTSALGIEPRFSDGEIEALRQQPTVSEVGAFTAARCQVRGQITVGHLNMVTDMFLEAVPDAFIDVNVTDGSLRWTASVNDGMVPIIIPRSYLNLYNYGYAATRGFPQVSEGLISKFPLRLMLAGNGQQRVYEARILGFSDRLNTILVPLNFLEEVNATMQNEAKKQPSRLIVATKASKENSQELLQYIDQHGYLLEGNADAVKMQVLVHGALMALIGIGALVSALAFYLLVVSILLLIEKNKERIGTLSFIGYEARRIALPYQWLVAVTDVAVWLLAAATVWMAYPMVTDVLHSLSPDFVPASRWNIVMSALGIGLGFALLHGVMICREIRRLRALS